MATRTRYSTKYLSLGRDFPAVQVMPEWEATKESAYYILAKMIDEEFLEEEPVTLEKIYNYIAIDWGLTKRESDHIVKQAIKYGYIRKGRVKL